MNQTNKIAVIGDIIADEYIIGSSDRLSPEHPSPVIKDIKSEIRCGGAANVAVCLSELTKDIDIFLTRTNDGYMTKVLSIFKKKKIKFYFEKAINYRTTVKKRIYVDKIQIVRIDNNIIFDQKIADKILNKLFYKIDKYNFLIISDYGKGQISPFIKQIIKKGNTHKLKTIIDPYGKDWRNYKHSYCLTPNKKELEGVVGKISSKADLIKKSKKLLNDLRLSCLLVTLGSEGMFLMKKNQKYIFLDAIVKQVFDVTGAGDTVCAAFTFFLSMGFDEDKAMFYANQFASLSVIKFGVSPVSIKEYYDNFIKFNDHNKIIKNKNNLKNLITLYKSLKLNIVFTNGCFDIIHAGHVKYLESSKNMGDILIVAVNSDNSIKKLKGENRPINKLDNRIKILASFSFIDQIIVFDDLTPIKLIEEISPNIITKGNGYKKNQVVGYKYLLKSGGKVKIINTKIDTSSTKILKRLK